MEDTRIRQILAALDDARTLAADIEEEYPASYRDFNLIKAGHMFTNSAITYFNQLLETP